MNPSIEIRSASGTQSVALKGDRIGIGTLASNEVVLNGRRIGRVHAVIEPSRRGWRITDQGAYGGTLVNGERIWGPYPLQPGDRIGIGDVELVYREDTEAAGMTLTGVVLPPPELEPVERAVLLALARPVLEGDAFSEPATMEEICRALQVTEAAVRHHLLALYTKFGILEEGDRRRVALAFDAIRRGAVTAADLRRD